MVRKTVSGVILAEEAPQKKSADNPRLENYRQSQGGELIDVMMRESQAKPAAEGSSGSRISRAIANEPHLVFVSKGMAQAGVIERHAGVSGRR